MYRAREGIVSAFNRLKMEEVLNSAQCFLMCVCYVITLAIMNRIFCLARHSLVEVHEVRV